jgi:hypothetical protein
MIVRDYLKPAAIKAGVLTVKNGKAFGPDGQEITRFGFHNFRHSLASFLMSNGEDPTPAFSELDFPVFPTSMVAVGLISTYNSGRPHSSLGPGIPDEGHTGGVQRTRTCKAPRKKSRVISLPILGGLHHEYAWERSAA